MARGMVVQGLVGLTIVATAIAGVVWWRRDANPPAAVAPATVQPVTPRESGPADPREADYVGTEACAKCHAGIAETYRRHPMANSTKSLDQDHAWGAGHAEATQELARFTAGAEYRVERGPQGMVHREVLAAADGSILSERAEPMRYTLGSGRHGCSFVFVHDGLLFLSPVSWYASNNQFGLSLGYDEQFHPQFERRLERKCVFCHAGRATPVSRDDPDRFRDPPIQEIGISCERCHGPGREHVELYESDRAAAATDTRIVNPIKLDPQRRDHVCYQCHLSGDLAVVRHGHQVSDYLPGGLLDDAWTVLVTGHTVSRDSRTKAVSQVEQMQSSRCFVDSAGRMGCVSCHDPHRAPEADRRVMHYRERCQTCHADRGCSLPLAEREASPAANSCVACHMPPLKTKEVAHTALTDHRILRRPTGDETAPDGRSAATLRLFGGAENRLPAWEVARARGIGLTQFGIRGQSPPIVKEARGLLELSLATTPDDVEVRVALARLSLFEQDQDQVRRHLAAALILEPDHEEALLVLGLACYQTGDYQTGLDAFDRLLRVNPWQANAQARQAEMRAAFGNLEGAIAAARRSVELRPYFVEPRSSLADYLWRAGQADESRRQRELVNILKKRYPESGTIR